MPRPRDLYYRVRGFVFLSNHPPLDDPAEYNDFREMEWGIEALKCDLQNGVLPNGLIIQVPGQLPGVVIPDPTGGQMVKPLSELLYSLEVACQPLQSRLPA